MAKPTAERQAPRSNSFDPEINKKTYPNPTSFKAGNDDSKGKLTNRTFILYAVFGSAVVCLLVVAITVVWLMWNS